MTDSDERQPLLTPSSHEAHSWRESLKGWKAHPYWLVPVIFVVNISRGVTMAPKIQVFKAIACRSLYGPSLGFIAQSDLQAFTDCSGADVAARAANIQAAVATTVSVLSALSTGFWSRFGDAYGRKPILILYLLGTMVSEFVFVLAMWPDTIFSRYAEQFILLGPIVEGLSGALATFFGLFHAYISDCTRHGSRSKIFSTVHGILFIGLAAGPWFTGILLPPNTSTNVYFYISITILVTTLLYTVAILPESRKRVSNDDSSQEMSEERTRPLAFVVLRGYLLKFFAALLSPIVMFAPRPLKGHPQKRTYILTFLGLGAFIHTVSSALYGTRYIFAQHLYSWSTVQLGYYMSLLWIIKAANLLVILPIVVSYFKPETNAVPPGTSPSPKELTAELQFDKRLTQVSLVLESALHLLVVISRKSEAVFVVLSCAGSFTSGVNPAIHSLVALCLHACGYSSEVGALFGAKAVLAAIAFIISPTIFASTYAATVAYFPQAIFILAAVLLLISTAFISAIRPSLGDINLASGMSAESVEEPSRHEEERS